MNKIFSIALMAGLLSQGCATILQSSKQEIRVDSLPQGADVSIDGQYKGQTPVTLSLERGKSAYIEVSKSGFEPAVSGTNRSMGAGWIIADILLTGSLGILVDAVTGNWYSMDETHSVKLVKVGGVP